MSGIELSRRKLFTFAAALVAAPTIVRVASIMPVRAIEEWLPLPDYVRGLSGMRLDEMVKQTLREHRAEIHGNMMKHNALLCRIIDGGLIIG